MYCLRNNDKGQCLNMRSTDIWYAFFLKILWSAVGNSGLFDLRYLPYYSLRIKKVFLDCRDDTQAQRSFPQSLPKDQSVPHTTHTVQYNGSRPSLNAKITPIIPITVSKDSYLNHIFVRKLKNTVQATVNGFNKQIRANSIKCQITRSRCRQSLAVWTEQLSAPTWLTQTQVENNGRLKSRMGQAQRPP